MGKTLDNKFAIQLCAHSLDCDPFRSLLHIKLASKLVVSASDCQFKIKFDFGTSPRVKSTMMMNNLANLGRLCFGSHNNGAKNKSYPLPPLRIHNVLRAKKITLAKGGGWGSKFDLTMGKRK